MMSRFLFMRGSLTARNWSRLFLSNKDYHLTSIIADLLQQTNFLQVLWRINRQGHGVSNCLMETRVGSSAIDVRLVPILQVILDVP